MKIQVQLVILALAISTAFAGHSKDEWKSRTIYQLLTDRFSRTDGSTQGCSDLGKYCGGSFKGITNNLDYIQQLGFDAIWISPVITNTDGGYHGYWAKDINSINSYFGSE
jgi:alpha-amylase